MKHRTVLASLVFLASAVAFPTVAQQPPTGPMVRAGVTTKLSEHAYAIPDNSVPGVPNVGFVVGANAILVIDTGMGKPNGDTVVAEAKKLGASKKLYLVTTHVHPEHDLGAQAFPAATTMIRSNAQVREIAEEGMRTADMFRGRSDTNKRLLEGAEFRKADVTFDNKYDLDLGGVTVQIMSLGPAHTQGDTGVWVNGDRVLYSGDVAMKAMPAFASSKSSIGNWMLSLNKLDEYKPAIVVPSHGPIGDAMYIAGYRTYLSQVEAHTTVAKRAGKTVEQATTDVTAQLKDQYPETGRMAGAIRAAYAEAN
ncbi:MAG TPA: MBL fold metallo-hydrolase [Hyphomonadaceae bacterium]|nr:MBL fold metallo-hydrolase [Hyphomonadaceae bacterium]